MAGSDLRASPAEIHEILAKKDVLAVYQDPLGQLAVRLGNSGGMEIQKLFGPVFWTRIPKIFPSYIRGTAMTVPGLTRRIANVVIVHLFPLTFHRIGKAITLGSLAEMALAQCIFVQLFVPETKNKPLEEIQEFWKAGAPVRLGFSGGPRTPSSKPERLSRYCNEQMESA